MSEGTNWFRVCFIHAQALVRAGLFLERTMDSLRVMFAAAAALAAGGASAMPASDTGAAPKAHLIVGVYNSTDPVRPTKAEFPFGCWYPDGWHGPGYYWCGYRPESYDYSYAYRPAYYYHPAYYYRPARYSYVRHRHTRIRHAWRRERHHWRA
jgi:hypothetical protein